jgi:hypothetical protein
MTSTFTTNKNYEKPGRGDDEPITVTAPALDWNDMLSHQATVARQNTSNRKTLISRPSPFRTAFAIS